MNRVLTRLGFTAAAIVAGSGIVAHAQTATTGAVSGAVTDGKGAPIAGATVRLTSAQTTRQAVTGADGSFRLGLLNPGAWTIEVTKSGLQKFTQNLTVLVNQTQPVNIKMASEAATVVEVLGTTATVDTTTTQTGLVTSMDNLSAIPKGRDMSTVALLAPGVVAGGTFGTGLNQHNDPSIGGGSGAENSYVVDGLSTTNTARGFQGAQLVTDFIDQVEVQTGGFKPEFSALGGVINAITKSGTNAFKGSAWATWDAIGIQAVPKRNEYFKQDPPTSRYDLGGEVSGPIIKDKLFFFIGVDGSKTESPESNNLPNRSGLRNGDETVDAYQVIGKINWYLTQDQQLTFSANVNNTKDDFPNQYPGTLGNAQLGYNAKLDVQNFVLNYDWNISPSLFLSAKLGTTQYKTTNNPTDTTTVRVTDYLWEDIGPGSTNGDPNAGSGLAYAHGGAGYYVSEDKTQTTQARVDLSWFLGNHNMKFGLSQLVSKYTEVAATSGGERVQINVTTAPTQTQIIRQFLHTNATVKAIINAFYAQDTWDVGAGVKLMYGFRFETQDQRDLHDKSFMKFDNFKDYVQPRLGFTWDVNQDGKTKVSGNYAKYFEQIPQRMAIRVYANETYLRYNYRPTNSTYDTATGAYTYGATPNSITDYGTPFSFDPIAEGTKLPERNEYILGVDHTFASGWTAGIHAKYRELKNPMEDMVFTDSYGNPYDEGPAISTTASGTPRYGAGAAVIGNPGAFQQWRPNAKSMTNVILAGGPGSSTYFGYPYPYNSYGINILDYYNPATGLFTVQNTGYEKAGNRYQSVDFTLDKKTDRDTFSFSYTWSRLEGNYEGVVSSSNGQADGNITASFDYFPYVGWGLLPNDRTHVVKLFASHRFDFFGGDLNVGVNWTYQSGTPNSAWDDGSLSHGRAPGYDTAHLGYLDYDNNTTLSGNPVVISSEAAYNNVNNWATGTGYGIGTQWIGPMSDTYKFLDIGFYGDAVATNGKQGDAGRSPALNNVDLHLDWAYKIGKKYKLVPSVDVFNLFNTRYATGQLQQATDQGGAPDPRYGAANAWQIGRRYRFGVKFQF
ncbi:TonB-dependent receptor [Geothrix terrae]|uniref:TonB-dependent receptor n=1 Tax=Geothrix terrae TaxID=2922720 RepID=UPI001FAE60BC|nr:TonB-dependent receptor [Geothrix terrae]